MLDHSFCFATAIALLMSERLHLRQTAFLLSYGTTWKGYGWQFQVCRGILSGGAYLATQVALAL